MNFRAWLAKHKVLTHAVVTLGVILVLVDVFLPPPLSLFALATGISAPTHNVEYGDALGSGDQLSVSVAGDEDPWNETVTFLATDGDARGIQLGDAYWNTTLADGKESTPQNITLHLGTHPYDVLITSGHVRAKVQYEEGRVPTIDSIHMTNAGITVQASDPNADAGDSVATYEFTIIDSKGHVVVPTTKQDNGNYSNLPQAPGSYDALIRVQDTMGGWSVTLDKSFTVIAALGAGTNIQEGQATLDAPATSASGATIFDRAQPGGGLNEINARMVLGTVRLLGCPLICHDPLTEGWWVILPQSWKVSIARTVA